MEKVYKIQEVEQPVVTLTVSNRIFSNHKSKVLEIIGVFISKHVSPQALYSSPLEVTKGLYEARKTGKRVTKLIGTSTLEIEYVNNTYTLRLTRPIILKVTEL